MGRRIDAVALIGPLIFVIEFKTNKTSFELKDQDQVVDYALDLHHFHEGSHHATIAPILVSTRAAQGTLNVARTIPPDGVFEPSKTSGDLVQARHSWVSMRRRGTWTQRTSSIVFSSPAMAPLS
jgi:hypothetical protein